MLSKRKLLEFMSSGIVAAGSARMLAARTGTARSASNSGGPGGLPFASSAVDAGDQTPGPARFNDGRDWFFQKRLGMFVHWGIYSVGGYQEQEMYRKRMTREEYLPYMKKFNPVKFNPDAWLDLAQQTGMEYLTFTTKHIDGFCMWDTQQTSYNIMHTPYGKDVLKMLSEASHRRQFPLCLYYAVMDEHQRNYPNAGRPYELAAPAPGDEPDEEKYIEFLRRQVQELCTKYGEIHGFWWDANELKRKDPSLNALIRSLQPKAVINNRGFDEGDYGTPERDWDEWVNTEVRFVKPVEACQSVGYQSWGYRANEDYYTVVPGMVVPVTLDDAERQSAIDAANAGAEDQVLVVPRLEGKYALMGVVATIEQLGKLPGGEPAAVLRALSRARVGSGVTGPGSALWVEAEILDEVGGGEALNELSREYKNVVVSILQQRGAWQVIDSVQRISEPGELADMAGYAPYLTIEQKLWLLETVEVEQRLAQLIEWGREHLAELDVAERIRSDVHEGMEKSQREFLLRQQLAAIRKELGEGEPDGADDYRARVEAAELPDKVLEAALREVGRLERASDQSPEAGWIRTWLDTVLELPWNVRTDDNNDVTAAREVLDADHEGLEDVKDRMVEYLAVRSRRQARGLEIVGGRGSGAVLALVGPPGVGKTSLGESVARALGRKFVRVSLGGVRDEAEIRGHRRTYVGALPGRIVRAIREAGSMNPVVLLDEIDKIGSDYRGDPASALLEVLDPAQNHTFRDHYLEIELDLSNVLFLATANVADTIPAALLDRMEIVRLDGYTEDEKVAIARNHLVPRQIDLAGLAPGEVAIDEEALRIVATEYTHEAGVRQLERAVPRPPKHPRLGRIPPLVNQLPCELLAFHQDPDLDVAFLATTGEVG